MSEFLQLWQESARTSLGLFATKESDGSKGRELKEKVLLALTVAAFVWLSGGGLLALFNKG